MQTITQTANLIAIFVMCASSVTTGTDEGQWRPLPLITEGKVDSNWAQIGWGGFAVDNGSLRTDCDEKGMGLLLYKAEPFGNCQIRVVYKSKEPKSNSGVFVRIDNGILPKLDDKPPAIRRDQDGQLSEESLKELMVASEHDRGPWYAVHHGFEVQICDQADEMHRTGAIYSLAKATTLPPKTQDEWRTMVITLKGNVVQVDVDGKPITTFDSESKDSRTDRKWFEPKTEHKRPTRGFIGLQNHDPGDVVYFKEVSVRPLRD